MTVRTASRPAPASGMVTIKDIARVVGVSSSTVARALNDSARISEATKVRVRAAARDLGYVAHSAARLMRGEAATVIGLTVPDIENDFYATLARAVAEVCRENGFQLVLSITEDEPESEFRHIRALVGAQAAGVVIVPTASPLPESFSLLERLPSAQLIRHIPGSDGDWFAIDDERGLREATAHLVAAGHERIAYVGASCALSTGAERVRGFRSALIAAGLPVREELIALGEPRPSFARTAFAALYEAERPTALVSGGSQITVGLIQAVAALRLTVPDDLSFVAYGDSPLYESWNPQLTAIALPVREIALAGTAALLRRARQDGAAAEPPQGALYLPRLKLRNSIAAPARRKAAEAAA